LNFSYAKNVGLRDKNEINTAARRSGRLRYQQ